MARTASGATVRPATPTSSAHPALEGQLAPGQQRTGWLEFNLPEGLTTVSLEYARTGATLFTVLVY